MTGQQPDPEVERLASDVLEGAEAYYCGPGYATCGSVGVSFNNARDIARAVLADLRARYILVPRDGATEMIDWGVRVDNRFPGGGRVHWTSHADGRREPDGGEQDARGWAASSEGAMHVVRRQVVHGAPEEVTP